MTRDERPGRAAVWMIGAIASFTSMAVAGRAVSIELDTFETMLYRSMIGFVIVCSVGIATGRLGEITGRHPGLHLTRNIFHFTGQNLWFYAVSVSPFALVIALEFTSPLWVALLSPFILGERLTPMRALAVVAGFVGVMLIVQPGTAEISAGTIAAALSAIGFAGSAMFTRKLTRTETTFCVLFWMTTIQMAFGIIAVGHDGDWALPSAATAPWIGLIGIAGLTAHFCLTTALTMAPASLVMQLDFARLPVIAVVGVLFYAEPIGLGLVLGASVILVANVINVRDGTRRHVTGM